jgi:opacity protein-like surface antigen
MKTNSLSLLRSSRQASGAVAVLVVFAALALPVAAFAQSTPPPPTTEAGTATAREPKQAAPLASVVRGFYIEAKGTGGYTVSDQKIPGSLAGSYPQAAGKSEKLGSTAGLQLNVGYDLTDNVALQVVGGELFASGRRSDVARDLSVAYGGLQARVAFDLTDRLDLLASAGVAYASQSNQVEKAQTGAAILGGIGFEYYVHVRHFSVGLELSAIAPTSPSRVFVGLSPQIKYTF